ncbi:hypothetical protein Syun_013941 [Stephania yunnanensis]|uniref:Uncharacterized protein n=1 Tax=Stephania yunnanensis TaxID=152371 RepID=A0AAP0JJG5_9MAGN
MVGAILRKLFGTMEFKQYSGERGKIGTQGCLRMFNQHRRVSYWRYLGSSSLCLTECRFAVE